MIVELVRGDVESVDEVPSNVELAADKVEEVPDLEVLLNEDVFLNVFGLLDDNDLGFVGVLDLLFLLFLGGW